MPSRLFTFSDRPGFLIFQEPVLDHMYAHAQTRWLMKEAGGQIFSANPHEAQIVVSSITGPNSRDQRSRCNYNPNPTQATKDRHEHFRRGLHPIGLWHTHPEPNPSPSRRDRETTKEYLKDLIDVMNGFILVILGNKGNPYNLAVWTATEDNRWIPLMEKDAKSDDL